MDTVQFNIINSLSVNDVGNPQHGRYAVTPLTYDPNNDVIYMAAPNNQNKTTLSVINVTTGSLLHTFNSIENYIISRQYDIFEKQLFAHIETDHENVTYVVETDTKNGKFKQILGTIREVKPTHISSYCPICRKHFLVAQQGNHRIYIGVNSTGGGGGISWQTPIDFFLLILNLIIRHLQYIQYTLTKHQEVLIKLLQASLRIPIYLLPHLEHMILLKTFFIHSLYQVRLLMKNFRM